MAPNGGAFLSSAAPVGGAILAAAEIRRDVTAVLTAFAPVLANFSLRDVVLRTLNQFRSRQRARKLLGLWASA